MIKEGGRKNSFWGPLAFQFYLEYGGITWAVEGVNHFTCL
jgi:hypothetical protein